MNDSFTRKAEGYLRAAGWFQRGNISSSAFGENEDSTSASPLIFHKYRDISLRPDKNRILAFGPTFLIGEDTNVSQRVISHIDLAVQAAVWKSVSQSIEMPIGNIAWEEGEDVHAIAVAQNGVVYCATWQTLQAPGSVDADVMKLSDTIEAYLNFWLDPSETTRKTLHTLSPNWHKNLRLIVEDNSGSGANGTVFIVK